jgi:hypothetical protein
VVGELDEFGMVPLFGELLVPLLFGFMPVLGEPGAVVVGEVGSTGVPLGDGVAEGGVVVSPAFGAGMVELGLVPSTGGAPVVELPPCALGLPGDDPGEVELDLEDP